MLIILLCNLFYMVLSLFNFNITNMNNNNTELYIYNSFNVNDQIRIDKNIHEIGISWELCPENRNVPLVKILFYKRIKSSDIK
jgi:hypothetical protein